ncbi:hypothetical protein SAMN02745194_04355 [Roseomonas rosea]|uniref:Uncharacterized protein n=1 Tax=Muricoccus roseus TaxID=198092 RepID=A0A1M6QBV7_9PROT|nr:hypothetical protein SAMN02745194_04355 [Roseomonas rosea]
MKSLKLNDKALAYYGAMARGEASVCFSQFGEDIVVQRLLSRLLKKSALDAI